MSLWSVYQNILLPAQATLMRLETGGIRVDLAKLKAKRKEALALSKEAVGRIQESAHKEWAQHNEELLFKLAAMEGLRELAKKNKSNTKPFTETIAKQRTCIKQWGTDGFRPTNNNWSRLLFTMLGLQPPPRSRTKKGNQKFDDKVFEWLIKQYPEVEPIKWRAEAVGQQKRASTQFGIVVDHRGYTHPSYALHRTATCRVASGSDTSDGSRVRKSEAGNLQNIPDEDRCIYIPDEDGGWFLAADWSQIQALILFWFAREVEGVRLIREGDIHLHNARILAEAVGLPVPASKEEAEATRFNGQSLRKAAKPMSYGVGFGMRERKAQAEYGGDVKVWKRIIDATFEAWPGLRRFHDEVRREIEDTHKLRNPWGLIQWYHDFEKKGGRWKLSEDAFREAVAWKVQSSEAMMCLITLPSLEKLLMLQESPSKSRLVTTTHDSFLISTTHQNMMAPQVRNLLQREWREMGTPKNAKGGTTSGTKNGTELIQESLASSTMFADAFWVAADLKAGRNWASKSTGNPQGLEKI